MTTLPAVLEKLKDLRAKATQGKWEFWNSNSVRRIGSDGRDGNIAYGFTHRDGMPDIAMRDEDGECIVAAVNSLDLLIAVAEAWEAFEKYMDHPDSDADGCKKLWLDVLEDRARVASLLAAEGGGE